MPVALAFNNTQFDVVSRNSQPWLRGYQIGRALGYTQPDAAISKIFDRNKDEFTESMTALVDVETSGGKQKTRVFSLRGCHLLAMFARTKVAKDFRKWVLDRLDEYVEKSTKPARRTKALPNGLTIEQQEVIKSLVLERVNAVPAERKAKVAVMCWSSLKSKFGCTYKAIAPERFPEAVSLVARLDLDGEYLPTGGGGEGGLYLSRYEAHHLYLLLQRFEILAEDREKLLVAAQALESKRLMGLFDQIAEGKSSFTCLNRRSDELFEMYQRPGISAGGGSLSA